MKNRLLIVDDSEEIREAFRDWMEEYFEIRETGNGRDAIELFEEFKPHLVFLDVHLKEDDPIQGIDLLYHMKKRNPSVIICMMTADASVKYAVLDKGADAFFEKGGCTDEIFTFLRQKFLSLSPDGVPLTGRRPVGRG